MLSINAEGQLMLLSQNETVVWLANSTTKALSPIAQLLSSGNLVLRDEKDQNPQNYLWQSFDYPSDTLLPGMKLGWDHTTGLNRHLTAWKSWDDPSPGDFTNELVHHNNPELEYRQGLRVYFRSGPWNGLRFSGTPELRDNALFSFNLVSNKDEVYYTYSLKNESIILRIVMNQTTHTRQRLIWIDESQSWSLLSSVPRDECDNYNRCGPYGICDMGATPVCQCLRGFKPKLPQNWGATDWTQGCVRSEPWSCREKNRDNFLKFSGLKLPETTNSWVNATMTLEECKAKCLQNCSCTAYANSNIRGGGSGCVIWFDDLIDIRQNSDDAQDLYIRLATLETAEHANADKKNKNIIATVVAILSTLLLLFTFLYIYRSRSKSKETTLSTIEDGDMELPFYDFVVVARATNNFSTDRKLGQGGFGPVYRGTMANGQEIAVKRLSQCSHQGMKEFKNEVILCAKLQHRNLVKVLGCSIQGEEKLLIYEYMLNKSLDHFIFSKTRGNLLDWLKRFHIIHGIARGLVYLHIDSRLRIIHRDLKTSNILLDVDMNPKISDFGLARTFWGDQDEASTTRVVGTHGYMSPEYAVYGQISIKSDVFSFGVIVLEIVSGKKNREFSDPEHYLNLLGHAWRLWIDGRPLELMDEILWERCNSSEVIRCIQVGLLCVQQRAEDRPDMSTVVLMLNGERLLPQPKVPGFYIASDIPHDANSSSPKCILFSQNEISQTMFEAR